MFEVAVTIPHPHVEVVTLDGLSRVVLVCLPLGTLFPEATSPVAARVSVAEPRTEIVRLAPEDVVAVRLVLERMAYLVGYGASHGLTGAGAHPERTDGVVVARTRGQPVRYVEQVYGHLVGVQLRLGSEVAHTQLLDVGGVERLRLLQQVVDINGQPAYLTRHLPGRGNLPERLVPEHDEMVRLPAVLEAPAVGVLHVVVVVVCIAGGGFPCDEPRVADDERWAVRCIRHTREAVVLVRTVFMASQDGYGSGVGGSSELYRVVVGDARHEAVGLEAVVVLHPE